MKIIAVLFAAICLVAGCSGSGSEEAAPEISSAAPEATEEVGRETLNKQAEKELGVVIDIGLYSGREPTPQGERVEVKVGQKITLRVTSATDEELHVHSDPEHTFQVKQGKDQLFSFTVDRPGQVAVEAHHAGVTIVQLVVRP